MADITKCTFQECPRAKKCYRFTAKNNSYQQSFADFKEYCNENNDFEFQIPLTVRS